ncbi:hypothetical protein [Legionella oakridgensis]|uniref:Uncharacterized protein n=2 Tax=Legionella oakridgensis TaxID=29423 RepID=W0BGD9_9GAMM|nr:hypothetical protein [Legionella oakridgensis]AHE67687.1 hypothetical protein Loa_02144 [Legionella oakridgensis ATCC 33761 = DSM 21215]KTD36979.1 hypothetical protein Loak_2115 [Legionella oakridgensis]STY20712.1 Uncharacterised protein [Legionella longbeachae]
MTKEPPFVEPFEGGLLLLLISPESIGTAFPCAESAEIKLAALPSKVTVLAKIPIASTLPSPVALTLVLAVMVKLFIITLPR